VLPRIPEVSPPSVHLLYECTIQFHGCIRMNATCLANKMQTATTLNALFKSLNKRANFLFGREALTKSTQPNVQLFFLC
jgi:hypothetical protein